MEEDEDLAYLRSLPKDKRRKLREQIEGEARQAESSGEAQPLAQPAPVPAAAGAQPVPLTTRVLQAAITKQKEDIKVSLRVFVEVESPEAREILSEFLFDMGPRFSGCHLEEEWDEVDEENFSTFKAKLLSLLPQEGEEIQKISIRPMGWGEHMETGKGVVGPE
jgi:hypothetical protein